jgi:hypothetical protein
MSHNKFYRCEKLKFGENGRTDGRTDSSNDVILRKVTASFHYTRRDSQLELPSQFSMHEHLTKGQNCLF